MTPPSSPSSHGVVHASPSQPSSDTYIEKNSHATIHVKEKYISNSYHGPEKTIAVKDDKKMVDKEDEDIYSQTYKKIEDEDDEKEKEDKENEDVHFQTSRCKTGSEIKKKVIVDVGTSGLGNRMIAITSAVEFAMKLDRVLEIRWEKNVGCTVGNFLSDLHM